MTQPLSTNNNTNHWSFEGVQRTSQLHLINLTISDQYTRSRNIALIRSLANGSFETLPRATKLVLIKQKITKAFAEIFSQQLESLELTSCTFKKNAFESLIRNNSTSLKNLNIDGGPDFDCEFNLSTIRLCTQLENLTIWQCNIKDETISIIFRGISQIKELYINNCIYLSSSFEKVSTLRYLQKFTASATHITDEELAKILEKLGPQLLELDISTSPDLTASSIKPIIDHCSSLNELHLEFNEDILGFNIFLLNVAVIEKIENILNQNNIYFTESTFNQIVEVFDTNNLEIDANVVNNFEENMKSCTDNFFTGLHRIISTEIQELDAEILSKIRDAIMNSYPLFHIRDMNVLSIIRNRNPNLVELTYGLTNDDAFDEDIGQ